MKKITKKKVKADEIEKIEVRKSVFGKSVTISPTDYDILRSAAQKYTVSEKSAKKLKDENERLKNKVSSLEKENSALKAETEKYKTVGKKSVISAIHQSSKEAENERMRSSLKAALQVIENNGLKKEFEAAKRQVNNREKIITNGLTSEI